MKAARIILALAGVVIAAAKPSAQELHLGSAHTYSFDEFLFEFGKRYDCPKEYARRKAIFEQNINMVREHNSKPSATYKLGVNHMMDSHDDEFDALFGLNDGMLRLEKHSTKSGKKGMLRGELGGPKAEYNHFLKEEHDAVAATKPDISKLPKHVDWRTRGIITPVKDQGGCGSCWAFAAAEVVESYWARATGNLVELSEQQILDCTPNPEHCGGNGGCQGATCGLAYENIMKAGGLATEWTYPYLSHSGGNFDCRIGTNNSLSGQNKPFNHRPLAQLAGWVRVPENSYEHHMWHLAVVGPLAVSVDASKWKFYEQGIFDGCFNGNDTNVDINHAVQLVGYGTDEVTNTPYWLIRNSWTSKWGEGGYMRIRRNVPGEVNFCGVDRTPEHGNGCDGGPTELEVCGTCGILSDSSYVIVGRPDFRPVNPTDEKVLDETTTPKPKPKALELQQ